MCGYVDVRDVCVAMVRLAEDRELRGERFALNGGNYSYKELFTVIARHRQVFFNRKCHLLPRMLNGKGYSIPPVSVDRLRVCCGWFHPESGK